MAGAATVHQGYESDIKLEGETSTFSAPFLPSSLSTSQPSPSSSPDVVVLVDGTWSQAKQILSRYPFLTNKFVVRKPWLKISRRSTENSSRTAAVPLLRESYTRSVNSAVGASDGTEAKGNGWDSCSGFAHDSSQEENMACLCHAVKFRSAGSSGYGFRKEPSEECISTLESAAYTLEVGEW